MKRITKIITPQKEHINYTLIFLSTVVVALFLMFIAAKNILPDLLGNRINNKPIAMENEKLLYKKAPDFDLSDGLGGRIELEDFINTPLVLLFWSTWDRESVDQIRILDDYFLSNSTQNSFAKVIAINSLEEDGVVRSFVKRGAYSLPVGYDTTGEISNVYNIKSLPAIYFIGKAGTVEEIYTGVLSAQEIVDKVENLLK